MDEQSNVNAAVQSGSSAGPIIGAIVILAVVIFGALYFWGQRSESQALNNELDTINIQSESDTTADIEADLNSTELENLDAEMNAS
ncbi:MAG: hypothetical protein Q7R67_00215 [bacterium]|nr:hypothetical protein [bacterium]